MPETLRRSQGYTMLETMVAVALTAGLLGGLAVAQQALHAADRRQQAVRHCIAAAEAQLDSIQATGEPLGEEDFARLWPGLTSQIARTAGRGDWTGLVRVCVTVRRPGGRYPAEMTLARYVRSREDRP